LTDAVRDGVKVDGFDNEENLREVLAFISERLGDIS
jgi:hypothetical protein